MVKDLCFEIIESCTNNCMFCSSNSCIDKKQVIKFEDFKRTIDYFNEDGGIKELSLSGGEPFLHPDLFKFIEYAKKKNIRVVIFTSGVIKKENFSKSQKEYMLKEMNLKLEEVNKQEPWNERLMGNIKKYYMQYIEAKGYTNISKESFMIPKELGVDKIVFDFQAYQAETDYMIMGRNEQSRQAFLTSMIYASLANIECDAHFIPMKPNYREISDIIELLEIANIKNVSILNFVPQGRGRKNISDLYLNEEELKEFFEILDRSKERYSGKVKVGIPLNKDNIHKCNAGLEKLDVKFDGSILPCPAFKELTKEECEKNNIKIYNIYESLQSVKIKGLGTRIEPLCHKIYGKIEIG